MFFFCRQENERRGANDKRTGAAATTAAAGLTVLSTWIPGALAAATFGVEAERDMPPERRWQSWSPGK